MSKEFLNLPNQIKWEALKKDAEPENINYTP
jgi:hypothetical protein